MLGPLNWGLPLKTSEGRVLGLHGAAANIPVQEATVQVRGEELLVTASFEVRDRTGRETAKDQMWYETGKPVYWITKRLIFHTELPGFMLHDEIVNQTATAQKPDWGYHVQLYPRPASRYLVPSRSRHLRGGGVVERHHEVWTPVKPGSARVERGVVHRRVMLKPGILDGGPGVPTLLRYPDDTGIEVILQLRKQHRHRRQWSGCG